MSLPSSQPIFKRGSGACRVSTSNDVPYVRPQGSMKYDAKQFWMCSHVCVCPPLAAAVEEKRRRLEAWKAKKTAEGVLNEGASAAPLPATTAPPTPAAPAAPAPTQPATGACTCVCMCSSLILLLLPQYSQPQMCVCVCTFFSSCCSCPIKPATGVCVIMFA